MRSILRFAWLLTLLVAPALAQSPHDLRRELAIDAGGQRGRVSLRPALPTWQEEGDVHRVEVVLELAGARWTGTARGQGDRTYGVLQPERAGGAGIADVIRAGGEPVEPREMTAVRLDLREEGLACRGTLLTPSGAVTPFVGARPVGLPIDPGWDGLRAEAKRDALWTILREHPYAADALPVLGSKEALNRNWRNNARVLTELPHLAATFRSTEDVRDPRWKLRHPFGAAATASLEPLPGHPYTGVLRSGAVGIVRLSLNVDDARTWNPGIGLKLLIDGGPSVNVNASAFFDPTTTDPWYFAHAPETRNHLGRLDLTHLATVTADGARVAAPRAPHVLRFEPAAELPLARDAARDFRLTLAAVPAGAVLYRVLDQDGTPVALLRAGSSFVASDGGDRLLHVSHHGRPER